MLMQCGYCAVPVGKGGVLGYRYRDGRNICDHCHSSAVKSEQSLAVVRDQTLVAFGQLAIDVDLARIPVQLLHRDALCAEAGCGFASIDGLTRVRETRSIFGKSLEARIHIVYGAPRARALAVYAHEGAHVFVAKHGWKFDPPEREEGFTQLVAHLALEILDDVQTQDERRRMWNNPDPVYGEGFRAEFDKMQYMGGWKAYICRAMGNHE